MRIDGSYGVDQFGDIYTLESILNLQTGGKITLLLERGATFEWFPNFVRIFYFYNNWESLYVDLCINDYKYNLSGPARKVESIPETIFKPPEKQNQHHAISIFIELCQLAFVTRRYIVYTWESKNESTVGLLLSRLAVASFFNFRPQMASV